MVSVVIPVYNGEDFLAEAVESVLRQTEDDFELIVVDDGSTDRTPEVCRAFGDSLRYMRKDNGGCASAFNHGIARSRGELVAVHNHDDLWLPRKLEVQMEVMRETGCDLVFTDAADFAGEPPGPGETRRRRSRRKARRRGSGDMLYELLGGNVIPAVTPLFRRSCFDAAGGFDESLRNAEDYDLWLRMAARGCRFAYVDRVLALRRRHPGGKSRDPDAMHRAREAIMEKLFSLPWLPEAYRRQRPRAEASLLRETLGNLWRSGKYREYVRRYRRCRELDPSVPNGRDRLRFARALLLGAVRR